MSEAQPEPDRSTGHAAPPPPAAERGERFPFRLVVFALVVLYGVLFAVFNSDSVEVSFVFFTADVSLVVALALALVIGFAAGYMADAVRSRRRRRAAKD